MRIPDIEVSEIEEELVIHRYRLSQSVLSPYTEGKEETGILLASPSPPVQIRIDNPDPGLDVGLKCRDFFEIECIFCLAAKTELEEISGESKLE